MIPNTMLLLTVNKTPFIMTLSIGYLVGYKCSIHQESKAVLTSQHGNSYGTKQQGASAAISATRSRRTIRHLAKGHGSAPISIVIIGVV